MTIKITDLIKGLRDNDSTIRTSAAEALGKMGKKAKAAVPTLIAALKDRDEKVRRLAAEALGEIGLPAVPALIKALKDQEIRRDVAYALGRIEPTSQEIINALTEVMNNTSNDLDVRRIAAAGLERNGVDIKSFLASILSPCPSPTSAIPSEIYEHVLDIWEEKLMDSQLCEATPAEIIEQMKDRCNNLYKS